MESGAPMESGVLGNVVSLLLLRVTPVSPSSSKEEEYSSISRLCLLTTLISLYDLQKREIKAYFNDTLDVTGRI